MKNESKSCSNLPEQRPFSGTRAARAVGGYHQIFYIKRAPGRVWILLEETCSPRAPSLHMLRRSGAGAVSRPRRSHCGQECLPAQLPSASPSAVGRGKAGRLTVSSRCPCLGPDAPCANHPACPVAPHTHPTNSPVWPLGRVNPQRHWFRRIQGLQASSEGPVSHGGAAALTPSGDDQPGARSAPRGWWASRRGRPSPGPFGSPRLCRAVLGLGRISRSRGPAGGKGIII